jgi:hypothetical protein
MQVRWKVICTLKIVVVTRYSDVLQLYFVYAVISNHCTYVPSGAGSTLLVITICVTLIMFIAKMEHRGL